MNKDLGESSEHELDLRRVANARLVRRVVIFVITGVGFALVTRYNGELVHVFRAVAASELGLMVPENTLLEVGFGAFFIGVLLHLLFVLATLVWQWRTFVPMLQSKLPEEVSIALIRLTSIFATSQRLAQSRQVLGAGALVVGLVRLFQNWPAGGDLFRVAIAPASIILLGMTLMAVSFIMRYGFPYSRTVLVPLLEAVVGAEHSQLSDDAINARVDEIVARVRKQKPWWFFRPTWFL